MIHEYVGETGTKGETHARTFSLLIIDTGNEEERVLYCIFEQLVEELLSEALDRLVCTEEFVCDNLYGFSKGY